MTFRMFQHTAARRRLLSPLISEGLDVIVSTHSRAEAAAFANVVKLYKYIVSTHSRAEAAAKVHLRINIF